MQAALRALVLWFAAVFSTYFALRGLDDAGPEPGEWLKDLLKLLDLKKEGIARRAQKLGSEAFKDVEQMYSKKICNDPVAKLIIAKEISRYAKLAEEDAFEKIKNAAGLIRKALASRKQKIPAKYREQFASRATKLEEASFGQVWPQKSEVVMTYTETVAVVFLRWSGCDMPSEKLDLKERQVFTRSGEAAVAAQSACHQLKAVGCYKRCTSGDISYDEAANKIDAALNGRSFPSWGSSAAGVKARKAAMKALMALGVAPLRDGTAKEFRIRAKVIRESIGECLK